MFAPLSVHPSSHLTSQPTLITSPPPKGSYFLIAGPSCSSIPQINSPPLCYSYYLGVLELARPSKQTLSSPLLLPLSTLSALVHGAGRASVAIAAPPPHASLPSSPGVAFLPRHPSIQRASSERVSQEQTPPSKLAITLSLMLLLFIISYSNTHSTTGGKEYSLVIKVMKYSFMLPFSAASQMSQPRLMSTPPLILL